MNIKLKRCKPCGCTHTHTHTHTHTQVFLWKLLERRKLVYDFFLGWSEGGSRELQKVSMLPRDLS